MHNVRKERVENDEELTFDEISTSIRDSLFAQTDELLEVLSILGMQHE